MSFAIVLLPAPEGPSMAITLPIKSNVKCKKKNYRAKFKMDKVHAMVTKPVSVTSSCYALVSTTVRLILFFSQTLQYIEKSGKRYVYRRYTIDRCFTLCN